MTLLINIINADLHLSLYLTMMSFFNLKFTYTNSEFTKQMLKNYYFKTLFCLLNFKKCNRTTASRRLIL